MMRFSSIRTSVVILAKRQHNPTILHPYFLKNLEIVPYDEKEVKEVVCTPAFSTIKYNDGLNFLIEGRKFQVLDEFSHEKFNNSKVSEYACKYIEQLPHVEYVSVGINFSVFLERINAQQEIIDRFLRDGPWNDKLLRTKALGLNLVYDIKKTKLKITIDSGTVQHDNNNLEGIIIDANYHTDCLTLPSLVKIVGIVNEYNKHCNHFYRTIRKILK